jgi:hypothetical protein
VAARQTDSAFGTHVNVRWGDAAIQVLDFLLIYIKAVNLKSMISKVFKNPTSPESTFLRQKEPISGKISS